VTTGQVIGTARIKERIPELARAFLIFAWIPAAMTAMSPWSESSRTITIPERMAMAKAPNIVPSPEASHWSVASGPAPASRPKKSPPKRSVTKRGSFCV